MNSQDKENFNYILSHSTNSTNHEEHSIEEDALRKDNGLSTKGGGRVEKGRPSEEKVYHNSK